MIGPRRTTAEYGRAKRWRRLLNGRKAIHVLAMDHPLSLGWIPGQADYRVIAERAMRSGLRVTVCHVGMIDILSAVEGIEIVLQLFGSTPADKANKNPIATAEDALALDCAGVAVEYRAGRSSNSLTELGHLVAHSKNLGLPVLVMVSLDDLSFAPWAEAVLGAASLGADLIKSPIPDLLESERLNARALTRAVPPLLMAGGLANDFTKQTEVAVTLGFSGTCIGRQFFDEKDDVAQARISATLGAGYEITSA